uniref:Uncharacterized protein n=1 Tax=viral metagenome TaxID=1070528 RepID=A0A6C0J7G5_9ZZZZ
MSTTASNAAPTGTTPAAPAPPVQDTTAATSAAATAATSAATTVAAGWGVVAVLGFVLALLAGFLFSFGAAKLSYDTYGNILWAILDFFFASVYYPFYALVLHQATPAPTGMLGMGRRRKH